MKEIARVMGMIARDFEGNKTAAQEAVVAITKKYPIYESFSETGMKPLPRPRRGSGFSRSSKNFSWVFPGFPV